jgi:diguanylate cyclase (GGDEF)-like protein
MAAESTLICYSKPLANLHNSQGAKSEQLELSLMRQALMGAGKTTCMLRVAEGTLEWSDNAESAIPSISLKEINSLDSFFKHIVEEDRTNLEYCLQRLQEKPGYMRCDYRLRNAHGGQYLLHAGCSSVAGPTGQVEYILQIIEPLNDEPLNEGHPRNRLGEPPEFDHSEEFMRVIREAIKEASASNHEAALMIVAINNFNIILNAYGHHHSEKLMESLQKGMASLLSPNDTIQRLHRDQFGVVLKNTSLSDTKEVAQHLIQAVHSHSFETDAGPVQTSSSIGSVSIPTSAGTASDALDKAYLALHKCLPNAMRSFEETPDETAKCRQQMRLANYLRKAIDEKRLRLAFQPIIESRTGHIAHYECLLRLVDDEGRISSAGVLIPIAERMGLINLIDQLVLEMVAKELRESTEVSLAFNVSNLTTNSRAWMDKLSRIISETPEIAPRMIVEVTETAAQLDLRETAYFVASVQALGCLVALDDFGSGYTSFRQLKTLSVDMLKIDGSFIRDLMDNADNRFFVKTLLEFTNAFGLKAVAECVETGETAKLLMELGVEYLQGFYFSKAENHRAWLKNGEYDAS